jgi:hypothetical protein
LDFIQLAENYIDDMTSLDQSTVPDVVGLVGGEGAAIGWAHGQAIIRRGEFLNGLQEERLRLFRDGIIKAIGYCHRCRAAYKLEAELCCSTSTKHKRLKDVVYTIPECVEAEVEVLNKKYKVIGG